VTKEEEDEDEEAPLKAMDEVARVQVLVEKIEMGIAEVDAALHTKKRKQVN
jgi:hypothetical protein